MRIGDWSSDVGSSDLPCRTDFRPTGDHPMKRLPTALLAAVLLLPVTASAHDKLTVVLDWFVNPDHAPLVVAKNAGIFDRHDLLVDLVAPADPNDPPKLVAAGKADVAISYQPQLHMQEIGRAHV